MLVIGWSPQMPKQSQKEELEEQAYSHGTGANSLVDHSSIFWPFNRGFWCVRATLQGLIFITLGAAATPGPRLDWH